MSRSLQAGGRRVPGPRRERHAGNGKLIRRSPSVGVEKCPTGIEGLDQITGGGLPRGRPTLVCGGPGCGKTLMAMEFLVRGATDLGEPGVFVAFEEMTEELAANVASLGFDLRDLVERDLLVLDHIQVERGEIEETGEYDLEGLFVRLNHAIDSVGAKRVVLDTIESLFAGLENHAVLRAELRRLFRWLKEKGVTAVITGERGGGQLTRQGLEEYVSDCVILLDNRVENQISTRRLRIVKYRGSSHGANEYPFLIDRSGLVVLPITALSLRHEVSSDRISTGIPAVDDMLDGGYYRGSSILVSGTAGTGKTSFASHFIDAACRRGERCLYFAFEESAAQITRNMRSIGLDLGRWVKSGRLTFHAERPTAHGLEMHLLLMQRAIEEARPDVAVFDPLTSLIRAGSHTDTGAMLMRLIDFLKARRISAMFTSLTRGPEAENSELGVSSLMDTWIVLRDMEVGGELNRVFTLIKSRGIAHSNQVREFNITDHGFELREPYLGGDGTVTGSVRLALEEQDRLREEARRTSARENREQLERRLAELQSAIDGLQGELRSGKAALDRLAEHENARLERASTAHAALARSRRTGPKPATQKSRSSRTHKGGVP